ncbi:MAG TPA: choice-of-anchor tandem repeat GloVer-containing protein, partial [Bryobacteraceae bacterium]|nr:choice-of-anchor tandem repeat GloVer-containing protein [Bryobacteraceae bacterium]
PAAPGGAWTETVLHNFAGGPGDGANPYAAMIIAGESGGLPIFYGTTYNGGIASNGTVFRLTPPAAPGGAWTESILHFFTGSPGDGANPHTAVTPGPGGVYYGTTYNGGASNNGTVFQLTPPAAAGGAWTESVLYSFAGTPTDGANPHGDMVLGPGGILYGTTLGGGPMGRGSVFSLTPPTTPGGKWTETMLHGFTNGTDASEPRAGLVISTTGGRLVLYGTSYLGGAGDLGTVFSLTAPASPGGAWAEAVLYSFLDFNGINPEAGVVMDSAGALYGAAYSGGQSNLGLIYYLVP